MKQRFPNMKKRCLLCTILWRHRQSVFRSRCLDDSTPNSVSPVLRESEPPVLQTVRKLLVESALTALNGSSSGHEIDDKNNQRDHEDQVNQVAGHETAKK